MYKFSLFQIPEKRERKKKKPVIVSACFMCTQFLQCKVYNQTSFCLGRFNKLTKNA